MLILGIESASVTAGTALVRDGEILAEYTLDHKKTHSQTLLPMIDEMMRIAECLPADLDGIAISSGPGSYTGLRIGSATAKGLGLALNKPLIPVPTLMALAFESWAPDMLVCPLMDARRGQVYTALYRMGKGLPEAILEPCCVMADEWFAKLREQKEGILFNGDGLAVCREFLAERQEYVIAPAHHRRPSAAAAAVLGEMLFSAGVFEAAGDHLPNYLKKSQAERAMENGGIIK